MKRHYSDLVPECRALMGSPGHEHAERESETISKLAFVKPKRGQDPVKYIEEEVRKATEVLKARIEQFDERKLKDIGFVVNHLLDPIMGHRAKILEWLADHKANFLTVGQMHQIKDILIRCNFHTLKTVIECMKKRRPEIEKASETPDDQTTQALLMLLNADVERESEPISVHASRMDGTCYTLSMKKSATGADVKHELAGSTGIAAIYQRLLLNSVFVQDSDVLSSFKVDASGSLRLTMLTLDPERAEALATLAENGFLYGNLPETLQLDRDVIFAALATHGSALRFMPESARNDRDIVLAAVASDGYALKYVSPQLKQDRGVVLKAVRRHGRALQFAPHNLRGDQELVHAALRQNSTAFQFASLPLYPGVTYAE